MRLNLAHIGVLACALEATRPNEEVCYSRRVPLRTALPAKHIKDERKFKVPAYGACGGEGANRGRHLCREFAWPRPVAMPLPEINFAPLPACHAPGLPGCAGEGEAR